MNTLFYGRCIKIRLDGQFQHTDIPLGFDAGLQNLDGVNDSFKAYFTYEASAYDLITGVHPHSLGFNIRSHTAVYFMLG